MQYVQVALGREWPSFFFFFDGITFTHAQYIDIMIRHDRNVTYEPGLILQRTAKKCTKNSIARPFFSTLNLLPRGVAVAVALVVIFGPSYGLGYPRKPSPRKLYRAFICEDVVPVGRIKIDSITVGFAELIFASFIRISALDPKSRHNLTLARPRVVLVRLATVFISRKVFPLARVTLPYPLQDNSPTRVVSLPEDGFAILM